MRESDQKPSFCECRFYRFRLESRLSGHPEARPPSALHGPYLGTGQVWKASSAEAKSPDFSRDDGGGMDGVCDDGDAEFQPDGSFRGEIRYCYSDELPVIAKNGLFNSLLVLVGLTC